MSKRSIRVVLRRFLFRQRREELNKGSEGQRKEEVLGSVKTEGRRKR